MGEVFKNGNHPFKDLFVLNGEVCLNIRLALNWGKFKNGNQSFKDLFVWMEEVFKKGR